MNQVEEKEHEERFLNTICDAGATVLKKEEESCANELVDAVGGGEHPGPVPDE